MPIARTSTAGRLEGRATSLTTLATILTLNLILFIIALGPDPGPIRRLLDPSIVVFDVALVSSSALLARRFFAGGSRRLGWLFATNLGIYVVAAAVRLGGLMFPPWAFALADIYWLNLYLICCSWKHRRVLTPNC